jgi:hypothetical protein
VRLGIELEALRELSRKNKIKWTLHALKRIRERKISANAVVSALVTGVIIERYQDDKPFPSCLILSMVDGSPLHVVASSDGESVFIITTYIPTLDEWENDFKTRKGQE